MAIAWLIAVTFNAVASVVSILHDTVRALRVFTIFLCRCIINSARFVAKMNLVCSFYLESVWARCCGNKMSTLIPNVQFFTLFLAILMPKSIECLSCLQCAAVPNYPTICPDDGVLDQLEVSFVLMSLLSMLSIWWH